MTMLEIPKRYMPIHRCMKTYIRYTERIPMIGPHRPLWAKYGEYLYLPPQRWLHNIEHGAIVLLYHPCSDAEQVNLTSFVLLCVCLKKTFFCLFWIDDRMTHLCMAFL